MLVLPAAGGAIIELPAGAGMVVEAGAAGIGWPIGVGEAGVVTAGAGLSEVLSDGLFLPHPPSIRSPEAATLQRASWLKDVFICNSISVKGEPLGGGPVRDMTCSRPEFTTIGLKQA